MCCVWYGGYFHLLCLFNIVLIICLLLIFCVEGRELVRILLAAGANPTAQDTQQYRTALHTAAMANDVELVKVI
jgi:ankyrin repeat protein